MELVKVSMELSEQKMALSATVMGSPAELALALKVPMGHYDQARFSFGDAELESHDILALKAKLMEWSAEAADVITKELLRRINAALSNLGVGVEHVEMVAGAERFEPPDFLMEFIKTNLAQAAAQDAMRLAQAGLQKAFQDFHPNAALPYPLCTKSPRPGVTIHRMPGFLIRKGTAWEVIFSQAQQHFKSVTSTLLGSAAQSFPICIVKLGTPPTHAAPVLCRDNEGSRELWTFCGKDGVMTMDLLENFRRSAP